MTSCDGFGKTICSICYEDLKPILEDLHSISICGHVFHELCLQQWFEYCSNSKKLNCPVCKRSCSATDAGRLYFQSVGDQNDLVVSKKLISREEDPEVLGAEVKRLEVKVSGLSSALERQEKEIREMSEELCLCKEQLDKEVTQKKEALREKASIQRQLQLKTEELGQSTSECSRLQERNMALAKELASIKLVSDLNLEQDEVLKLASLGNQANKQETIDTLIKSLAIRNRSYKELMLKCNLLGRGEARSCEKLEKAKQKVDKLKKQVKELENIVEAKDNEVLRALKASRKSSKKAIQTCANNGSNSLSVNNFTTEDQVEQHFVHTDILHMTGSSIDEPSYLRPRKETNQRKGDLDAMAHNGERNTSIDEDTPKSYMALSNADLKHQGCENVVHKAAPPMAPVVSDTNKEAAITGIADLVGPLGSRIDVNDKGSPFNFVDKNAMFSIRKESGSADALSKPGSICFSGGLLGPDGTNRYLGKWCKRGHSKGSVAVQGALTSSGDLIAVGADGRGGRIKVLRSPTQSAMVDDERKNLCPKRFKCGARTSGLQSKGCLQIEHFFGKVRH